MLRKLSIIVCVLSTTIFLIMPSSDPQNFRKKVPNGVYNPNYDPFIVSSGPAPYDWVTDYKARNLNMWIRVFISGLAVASLAGIFVFKEDSKKD